MRLPLIKHIISFVEERDEDWINESVELLEYLSESENIKDEELNVIGELLSNLYGALEVNQRIKSGTSQKDALNEFMKRVQGSIDA